MLSVKLLAESGFAALGNSDRWYVSDGATAVGPVGLELLARGIEEGKVPLESYVRHEAWSVWRPLSEVAVVSIPSADSAAPTPPYRGRMDTLPSTDDITLPGRPLLPEEMTPSDALDGAADMTDALHLLMNAAVMQLCADAALVFVVQGDEARVHFAHGPFSRAMIGERMKPGDPVLSAASAGSVIMAEPSPGPAGGALLRRMLALGVVCEAAAMHPITVRGRLVAILEVGRKTPQLRASELAILERLVDAFVNRAEADLWE